MQVFCALTTPLLSIRTSMLLISGCFQLYRYPLSSDVFLHCTAEGGGRLVAEDDQCGKCTVLQQAALQAAGLLLCRQSCSAHSYCTQLLQHAAMLQAASCIGPAAAVQPALHQGIEDWKLIPANWRAEN